MTLKLSDEDAAVVGSILRAVSEPLPSNNSDEGTNGLLWYRSIRHSHTGRDQARLLELAGAFRVAVRANER